MRMARRSAGAVAIASLASVLAPVALPAVAASPRHPPTALVPLPAPAPLVPFNPAAGPGQGRWHPAGRLVDGRPGVFETTLVVPASGQEAGIAWMDPRLVKAQLYSGSQSPGGGPWKLTAPISPSAAVPSSQRSTGASGTAPEVVTTRREGSYAHSPRAARHS